MAAPEWCVRGTKKGAWPLAVETRKQHTVTVLRNVSGDVAALCKSLQDSLGAGGSTHGPLIELQGEHVERTPIVLCVSGRLPPVLGWSGAVRSGLMSAVMRFTNELRKRVSGFGGVSFMPGVQLVLYVLVERFQMRAISRDLARYYSPRTRAKRW